LGVPAFRRVFADQIVLVLVVVLVLALTVCFSEQPGTAPNPFSVSNFRVPGWALSDLNVQKIASWTFENPGPNHFEDENDDEDEYDGGGAPILLGHLESFLHQGFLDPLLGPSRSRR
jgi:hypothetical protein